MMKGDKVSPALSSEADRCAADDVLEIIVELVAGPPATPPGTARSAAIAARKERFTREAQPVEEAIRKVGGEILDRAWINQTMRARLPRRALAEVSDLAEVGHLDLGRELEAD